MDNLLYIPEVNPVLFYEVGRANDPQYFTRFLEKWMFNERWLDWQRPEDFRQVWQNTDIIRLQFESNFDPIIAKLLDDEDNVLITLPALIGLPNEFIPGTSSFEIEMALSVVTTSGCYRVQLTAGSGPNTKILISRPMYVSTEQIRNSILIEYYDSKRFHKDIVWATGIRFQMRILGHLGFLDKVRKDEFYHDEKWNPALLNSRSAKQYPVFFGDEFGIPDDDYNLLDEIWGLDNVLLDGKPFGIADNSKPEFIEIGDAGEYPKRGVKYVCEEGINRNSRIFAVDTDTTKKLMANIIVDAKVFGDVSNQGSSNAVPIQNIE